MPAVRSLHAADSASLQLQLVLSSTLAQLAPAGLSQPASLRPPAAHRLTAMIHQHSKPAACQIWLAAGNHDILSAVHAPPTADPLSNSVSVALAGSRSIADSRSIRRKHTYQGHQVCGSR